MTMREEVELKLIDGLTAPAKQATASARSLLKEISRFRSASLKANGFTRDIERMTRDLKKATGAAADLRKSISRPVGNGYARVANNLNGVRNAANNANAAANRLNRTLRSGGGGGSGGGRGGHGGRRGGGWSRGFAGHSSRHGSDIGHHVASALTHASVYGVVHEGVAGVIEVVKEGFGQSFDMLHSKVMLQLQGESRGMVDAAEKRAREMAISLPQFTSAQHMESINELRPALIGGLEEATKLAPMFQQAIAVIEAAKQGSGHKALSGIDSHGEALDLIRAIELKGVMKDGDEAIRSYANNMTKAIVAFNGQVKASDFHNAIKMASPAARGWSEQFTTQYLPSIINDLKSKGGSGQMAGTALMSMHRAVVDNIMTPKALKAWDELGLYGAGTLHKNKKGDPDRVNTGQHMKGHEAFMDSPLRFMDEYLLPAMKAKNKGVEPTEKAAIAKLTELFGNRVAARVANVMLVQRRQLEKDAMNVRDAMGPEGLDFLMKNDPVTRMQVLAASFKELGAALADILVPGTMRAFKGAIDWAHSTSQWIQKSPTAKTFKENFEAFTAGLFDQQDFKAKPGQQTDYQVRGAMIAKYFTGLKEEIKKQFEGAFTGDDPLGLKGVSELLEELRSDIHMVGEAAKWVTSTLQGLQKNFPGMFGDPPVPSAIDKEEAATKRKLEAQTIRERMAIDAERARRHGAGTAGLGYPTYTAPRGLRGGLKSAVPAVTSKSLGINNINPPAGGSFGLGGPSLGKSVIEPITTSIQSATPMLASSGAQMMSALAAGMDSGTAQATGKMSTLMGSLAALASAGVTIVARLDAGSVESQLNSLIAKANSIGAGTGKGGAKPQFTKALSDVGG